MKILERIVDCLIRQLLSIGSSQFGFVPGRGTTIFCCQAAAREVSSCQQETLHGFRRPGEGVRSSTLEGAVSLLVRGTVKNLK